MLVPYSHTVHWCQAREALAEMAEQNTRLVNAFVAKKEEAAQLRGDLEAMREDSRSQVGTTTHRRTIGGRWMQGEGRRLCGMPAELNPW